MAESLDILLLCHSECIKHMGYNEKKMKYFISDKAYKPIGMYPRVSMWCIHNKHMKQNHFRSFLLKDGKVENKDSYLYKNFKKRMSGKCIRNIQKSNPKKNPITENH